MWCPCGDHGTSIGYSNGDGGVLILDDERQAQQKVSAPKVVSQPATAPAVTAAISSAPPGKVSAESLASTNTRINPLQNVQQRCHRRNSGGDRPGSSPSHEQQQQLMQMNQQQRKHSDKSKPGHNAEGNPASSCELVDLTIDDCEQSPAQEPEAKRLRHELHDASRFGQTMQDAMPDPSLGCAQTASTQWACSTCTLLNNEITLQCSACGSVRPAGFPSNIKGGNAPDAISKPVLKLPQTLQRPVDHSGWTCKFCLLLNASGTSHCSACDQWRYSYGVPC